MDKEAWKEYREIEARADTHEKNANQAMDEVEITVANGAMEEATMAQVEATLAVSARLEALSYAIRHVVTVV